MNDARRLRKSGLFLSKTRFAKRKEKMQNINMIYGLKNATETPTSFETKNSISEAVNFV